MQQANPTTPAHVGAGVVSPLWRRDPVHGWEMVEHSLASPSATGEVAYFFDVLSPHTLPVDAEDGPPITFNSLIGRAAMHYLMASAMGRRLEISDGPYLQVLEDDGAVPPGWVVLRAVLWADEFDLVVPTEEATL